MFRPTERRYIEVEIKDLKPYEKNPRKNDKAVAAVEESFEQCGYISPIIVDENLLVLAGETRLKALKKRHVKRDNVLQVIGLTDEQKKKYRLLDNKVAEIADWDIDLLAEELEGLDFDGFDFGFDQLMEQFAEDPDPEDVKEDDYREPLPEAPTSERGQVYQLGRHRLMCGDSTSPEDVRFLMDGQLADLLVTDPPYNVNYTGGTADKLTIQNDNMEEAAFRRFLHDAFRAADAAMRPGAAFYIWHSDSERYSFQGACKDVEWQVRQCLIWNKNAFVLGRQDYQWKHEPCLYGWKDGAAHYFIDERDHETVFEDTIDVAKLKKDEMRQLLEQLLADKVPTTVINADKPLHNDIHPTMKPIALIAQLVANSSKRDWKVLDVFGGSGTTLMACEQLHRTCYTMELDPRYVDAIIDRWQQFTGQQAILLNG